MKKLTYKACIELNTSEKQAIEGGTDYAALAAAIANSINQLNWRQNTPPQN